MRSSSPAWSCFARFTRSPFTSTLPLSIAVAASARVLKKRAAQSHLSSLTLPTSSELMDSLPVMRVRSQEDRKIFSRVEQQMPQDDWSTQLKNIEGESEGLPPEPSLAYKKLQSEEQRRAQDRTQQRAAMIGGGARLVLVAALGVALAFWPYENSCGSGLLGYLAVEVVIIIGGL